MIERLMTLLGWPRPVEVDPEAIWNERLRQRDVSRTTADAIEGALRDAGGPAFLIERRLEGSLGWEITEPGAVTPTTIFLHPECGPESYAGLFRIMRLAAR